MSTGIETTQLIEPWLYGRLSSDAELLALVGDRIFGPITPDEIDGPYVTISMLSERDIAGVGTARFQVDAIYLVKAVAESSSFDMVADIAQRFTLLLDGQDVDYDGGHITCVRQAVVAYPEVQSGQAFVHLGGQFRIRANN